MNHTSRRLLVALSLALCTCPLTATALPDYQQQRYADEYARLSDFYTLDTPAKTDTGAPDQPAPAPIFDGETLRILGILALIATGSALLRWYFRFRTAAKSSPREAQPDTPSEPAAEPGTQSTPGERPLSPIPASPGQGSVLDQADAAAAQGDFSKAILDAYRACCRAIRNKAAIMPFEEQTNRELLLPLPGEIRETVHPLFRMSDRILYFSCKAGEADWLALRILAHDLLAQLEGPPK